MTGTMYEGGAIRMVSHASEPINWLTNTTNLALTKAQATYMPTTSVGGTNATDVLWGTVYATAGSGRELATDTGYTQKGKAVTTTTMAMVTDTYRYLKFSATAPAAWTGATFITGGAGLFSETATNDPLICWLDFGSDKEVSAGTISVAFDANGIFRQRVV